MLLGLLASRAAARIPCLTEGFRIVPLRPLPQNRPFTMAMGSNGEIQLEDDGFRVTIWTIDPGVIPMHRHDFEYVVVLWSPTPCMS